MGYASHDRGQFIDFRSSMINICPMGHNATSQEQSAFEKYDKVGVALVSHP